MFPKEYRFEELKAAMKSGGVSDLRFACDFADRIVAAVTTEKQHTSLHKGFRAYRARNDYIVDETSNPGQIYFYPLGGKEICAPPKDKTLLGRFNAIHQPVLYLSTTREVAIAETRALPTDTCSVGQFETVRPLEIAELLKPEKDKLFLFLEANPDPDDLRKWLLARTAEFISRRVPDPDRDLHYRTCNLISSAFRESGFDGLAYRTSFWSDGWSDETKNHGENLLLAANIVLFDVEAAVPSSNGAGLYRIDWKRPTVQRE